MAGRVRRAVSKVLRLGRERRSPSKPERRRYGAFIVVEVSPGKYIEYHDIRGSFNPAKRKVNEKQITTKIAMGTTKTLYDSQGQLKKLWKPAKLWLVKTDRRSPSKQNKK